MKVRPGLAPDDYGDPGWYKHPEGAVAYEWTGEPPPEPRRDPARPKEGAAGFRAVDPRRRRAANRR